MFVRLPLKRTTMDRVPGHAWLMVLAAAVLVLVASAVPLAPDGSALEQALGQMASATYPTVNLWRVAGSGSLVVTGLLLLFFYRRRLYILFWTGGWLLVSASMFLAARPIVHENKVTLMSYGVSQFLGILSALFFVISDAYRRSRACVAATRLSCSRCCSGLRSRRWRSIPGRCSRRARPDCRRAGGGRRRPPHLFSARSGCSAPPSSASLPLIAGSHVWVILRVASPARPERPARSGFSLVLYLLAALGMQLMTFEDMTLELRRTNRRLEAAQGKLRRMVITDPLTGCRNRRFFEEIIGRELQRHRRYGIPMSVLFVDVDRFKAVNDTLGHDAGDRVLREVAALLSNIREADYVFRWGGDEFLILLSCGEDEARRRGTALQIDFARYSTAATLPTGVGLSIGCAEVTEEASDVMALIKVADERMYENKRAHRRNRPQIQPARVATKAR